MKLIALALIVFLSETIHAQNAPITGEFSDEFSSAELNHERWNIYTTGFVFNNELQAYVDSKETLYFLSGSEEGAERGALVIHPRYRPRTDAETKRVFDFTSARLNTQGKTEFIYGTLAARIKMPDAEGIWPAFWALGNGRWPDTGEIDIMEYVGEKDWIGVALHGPKYSGETPLVNKYFFDPDTNVTDWHVYACDWTKDAIIFKVDDRVTYRVTRAMVEHYGQWVFDSPKHLILNCAIGGTYPHKTNGIKEPYYGLPQKTVDLIKEDKIRMLIDWVRVTPITR